jgi:protein O-mannosyl-transferase
MNRRWIYVIVLLSAFTLGSFGLRCKGIDAPMYYDSDYFISKNLGASSERGVLAVINIFPQRPVPMASYYLDYLMSGVSARHFRLVNMILLAATALIVSLLVELLLDVSGWSEQATIRERKLLSFCMGLIFLAHPVQTYLTLYVWQRSALMACFFTYSSLAAYVAVRSGRLPNRAGYFLCVVLFLLAGFSKENSVVLPAVFLIAEIAFFQSDWKSLLKRAAGYSALLLVFLGLMSLLQRPHGSEVYNSGLLSTIIEYSEEAGKSPAQMLFSQARSLFLYISMIVNPSDAKIQLISPQVIPVSILDPPDTLIAVLGAMSLIGGGLFFLRSRPLAGFGILFFLVGLLPESILVPQYSFFCYRAALPMVGLMLVAAECTLTALHSARSGHVRTWVGIGFALCYAAVIFLNCWVSFEKAESWNNPVKIWSDAVNQFPRHERLEKDAASQALYNLALAQQRQGDYVDSVGFLEQVVELNPKLEKPRHILGKTLLKLGRLGEAIIHLQKAVALKPENWKGHNDLGVAFARLGNLEEAAKQFRRGLETKPDDAALKGNLETALTQMAQRSREETDKPKK